MDGRSTVWVLSVGKINWIFSGPWRFKRSEVTTAVGVAVGTGLDLFEPGLTKIANRKVITSMVQMTLATFLIFASLSVKCTVSIVYQKPRHRRGLCFFSNSIYFRDY